MAHNLSAFVSHHAVSDYGHPTNLDNRTEAMTEADGKSLACGKIGNYFSGERLAIKPFQSFYRLLAIELNKTGFKYYQERFGMCIRIRVSLLNKTHLNS